MRFRKLRIAWSVGCGIATMLLIVLWVRSYWRHDSAEVHHGNMIMEQRTLGQYFLFASNRGRCACLNVTSGVFPWWISRSTSRLPRVGEIELFPFNCRETHGYKGFDAYWNSTIEYGAFAPHWFLVLISATFAAFPWLRWHFSLRTLLIATTLVAVLLGLVVWLLR
jgi:hypothetical protein